MTLWLLGSGGARTETRLGIVVSRRHGHAVARNRLKRTLREAFRRMSPQLPPACDILCQPKIGVPLPFADACESLLALAGSAFRRRRPG